MSRLNRVKAAVCGEAGFIKLSLSATHFSLTEKLLVNYLFLLFLPNLSEVSLHFLSDKSPQCCCKEAESWTDFGLFFSLILYFFWIILTFKKRLKSFPNREKPTPAAGVGDVYRGEFVRCVRSVSGPCPAQQRYWSVTTWSLLIALWSMTCVCTWGEGQDKLLQSHCLSFLC